MIWVKYPLTQKISSPSEENDPFRRDEICFTSLCREYYPYGNNQFHSIVSDNFFIQKS